ncbi:four-helix bundle copper-binding protein [Parabacteroides sp. PF5-9]|uniref:four-helix bundle copper-binding protein n=1 Tax=Parabacteroides sp. PF5-9 TaxID=1742404 RepID=UPI0024759524|nr:four-helix bundle copper-binding protein [Parabacteroides sp. PF5-9]MDH6358143.1 hypothetical protein [Parabacteroides sp. PF5-9]
MEDKMLLLTQKLAACQAKCNLCLNACLDDSDMEKMKTCIRLNKTCAEICGITLSTITSSSFFSKEVLVVCAKACKKCAAECKKHANDHCQQCAKACEECAEACTYFM